MVACVLNILESVWIFLAGLPSYLRSVVFVGLDFILGVGLGRIPENHS